MEFPPNSSRETKREESPQEKIAEKLVEKVVIGNVTRRRKPLTKKFKELFIAGESGRSVVAHVAMEVMVPAAKDMLLDAGQQFIERMLYGESSPARRSGRNRGPSSNYTNYQQGYRSSAPWKRDAPEPSRQISRRSRQSHDFDEIVLDTRTDAEDVISRLYDLINQYESASVADLYELVGVKGDFTDDKWGWRDLRGSSVSRVRGGYLLNLPAPEPFKD